MEGLASEGETRQLLGYFVSIILPIIFLKKLTIRKTTAERKRSSVMLVLLKPNTNSKSMQLGLSLDTVITWPTPQQTFRPCVNKLGNLAQILTRIT